MATQFAMPAPAMGPTSQYTPPPAQYNPFATQPQPISPTSSSNTTPQNSSPTSPRSVLPLPSHPQQLRPLKSPLYVPAVLRPTDPPRRAVKSSPITPPQSVNNSFDNLQSARPLSRTSTIDSGKFGLGNISETVWNLSDFPKVTDTPTRMHWKPDADASICDETTCTRAFGYFNRRHHCRRCGNIFCDAHSSALIPLDQDANFNPVGTLSRACGYCLAQYKEWETLLLSRKHSNSSEDQACTPTTPVVSCGGKARNAMGGLFGPSKDSIIPGSMGQSVPRDWNWSTF